MFFKNLVAGKDPKECPDNDGKNVDTIDALAVTVPIVISYHGSDRDTRNKKLIEAIKVTRNITAVTEVAIAYSDMLVDVLNGKDLRKAAQKVAT